MKIISRIFSILLYIISAVVLGIYTIADLNPRIMMVPTSRLILLGVICLCSYFGTVLLSKTVSEQTKKRLIQGTFIFYFLMYLFLLLTFVFFDSFFGRAHMGVIWNCDPFYFDNFLLNSVNLIPFKTVIEYIVAFFNNTIPTHTIITNIFGNILAFAPFGFFAHVILNKKPSLLKFTLLMVSASLLIEVIQLIFLVGSCDIDDVILNVLGAVIGYLIFKTKICKKIIRRITLNTVFAKHQRETITLISDTLSNVKVCDVINGVPKVKHIEKDDIIEFEFKYSLFKKEIKRYNRKTFEEIK